MSSANPQNATRFPENFLGKVSIFLGTCESLEPLDYYDRIAYAKVIWFYTDVMGEYSNEAASTNAPAFHNVAENFNRRYSLSGRELFTGEKVALVWKWFDENTGGSNREWDMMIRDWIRWRNGMSDERQQEIRAFLSAGSRNPNT